MRGFVVEALGRDLGALVLGAREHLPGDVGSLGSSFVAALVLDVEGLALGLRALEPRHLLGEVAAEAPPDPRSLRGTEGEAARETARGSPLWH